MRVYAVCLLAIAGFPVSDRGTPSPRADDLVQYRAEKVRRTSNAAGGWEGAFAPARAAVKLREAELLRDTGGTSARLPLGSLPGDDAVLAQVLEARSACRTEQQRCLTEILYSRLAAEPQDGSGVPQALPAKPGYYP